MSASLTSSRRRFSLLAGSSLAALTLATSFGVGASAILAPGVAVAQDECGAVAANGAAPDVFVCTGAYPTGINYTTSGNLVLGLQGLVSLPAQGLQVTGSTGDNIALLGLNGAGDLQITNAVIGISVLSDNADILIDLQDDAGDGTPTISGSANGILAVGDNVGNIVVNISDGTVQGGSQAGILLEKHGLNSTGSIELTFGLTSISGAGGIIARSLQGLEDITIAGAGTINSTAGGISAIAASGDVTIVALGDINSDGTGITVANSGGSVDIESGDITIGTNARGIHVQHGGGGETTVRLFGDIDASAAGSAGLVFDGNSVGGVSINSSGQTILADGFGMELETFAGDINVISGDVVSQNSTAIHATTQQGAIDITTTGFTQGDVHGIFAEALTDGNVSITTGGAVTGVTGVGVYAFTPDGDITLDTTGGLVIGDLNAVQLETQSGDVNAILGDLVSSNGFGLSVFTDSGDININQVGDISSNDVGMFLFSNSGDMDIDVGAVSTVGGQTAALEIFNVSGAIDVTLHGDTTAAVLLETGSTSTAQVGLGVHGNVNAGTGPATIGITGANGDVGVALYSGSSVTNSANGGAGLSVETDAGDILIQTATTATVTALGANGVGIDALTQSGEIYIISNADIIADTTGIAAHSVTGSSTVIVGPGAVIDPGDFGVTNTSGGTTSVSLAPGSTIIIANTDGDNIATGIQALSSAAADVFGDGPSVQVGLGGNTLITVDDGLGGEADGGFGVYANNFGLGTGGVSISASDGFGIDMVGDAAGGLVGLADGAGDVSITTGTGSIAIQAGDGVDGGSGLDFSAGILGRSVSGDVVIDTAASISVGGIAGGVDTFGVRGRTGGTGSVDITTSGLVQATHNGVFAITEAGDINITSNSVVAGLQGSGITARSNAGGDVSITTNALVFGGDVGIDAASTDGDILIDANFLVVGGSAGIYAVPGASGDVTITATDVTATGGNGIIALAGDGAVSVTTTGLVDAMVGGGVIAGSDTGDVSVNNFGQIDAVLTGITAQTAGAGAVAVSAGNIASTTGFGVVAESENGLITISADGVVQSSGIGLYAQSTAGRIDIDNSGSIGAVAGHGIYGVNTSGDITVISSGQIVTSTAGNGIDVETTSGILDVVNTGVISAFGTGIQASAIGSGSIFVDAGNISAGGGGVDAFSDAGNISITAGGALDTALAGLVAQTLAGTISVANTGSITALDGDGIGALSTSGDISVTNSGTIFNVASGDGIDVGTATGVITVVNTGAIDATDNGIEATAIGSGSIFVRAGDISAGGRGVDAFSDSGNIAIISGGNILSDIAGLAATIAGGGGGVDIAVTGGSIFSSMGIDAVVQGGGDIKITSDAGSSIVGTVANAIQATTTAGDILIDVDGEVIAFDGNGIAASSNTGDVTVLTGAGAVVGATSFGIGATAGGAGDVSVQVGAGGVQGLVGVLALATGTGDVEVRSVSGSAITAGATGIVADTISGGLLINVNGDVTAGGSGISAESTVGDIGIQTGPGAILAGGNGIFAKTNGDVAILVGGNVTAGTGTGVWGSSANGDVSISVASGNVVAGNMGLHALSMSGDVSINMGAGSLTAGNTGLVAGSQTGDVTVTLAGDITAALGIQAVSTAGDVTVLTGNGVIAGSSLGITAQSNDGDVTIRTGGAISSTGNGILGQSTTGSLLIDNGATIAGTGTQGLFGSVSQGSGDLTILNSGAIGSAGDGVTLRGISGSMGAASSGDALISSDADIFADGFGILATQSGVGDLTVNVGLSGSGTVVSGGNTGVLARILNAASVSTLNVNVGDNATILGGVAGLSVLNSGVGGSTVTLGDNVLIDPNDYGVDMLGGGDQTFLAGDNLTVIVGNTDNDTIAVGLNVVSTAAANTAVGDPAVEIAVGNGLDITIDDGFGGDADGAIGISARAITAGTAGVQVILDGPTISITGDNSLGVRALTSGGDIAIRTGAGLIDLAGGDGTDAANNFGFSAGIFAGAGAGNININNAADINVANLVAGGGYGILTETVSGDTKLENAGDIVSTFTGIFASSVDGAIDLFNSGDVSALLGNGLWADSGSGDIVVGLNDGATIQAGQYGILASSAGQVGVSVSSGGTINAGIAGIYATSATSARATLGNNVTIDPEDYGVFISSGGDATFTAGSNLNVTVGNIDGDAEAIGIALFSSADFDLSAFNPAVELAIGTGFALNMDDGFGGDADGATGIWASATDAGSTASIDMSIGAGIDVTIIGDSSIGIRAATANGDIALRTGTGLIEMLGGDGTDANGNYGFSAAIMAASTTGDITINNAAQLFVANAGVGDAYGIVADTGGAGRVSILSDGPIISSLTGIRAESFAGDIAIDSNSGVFAAAGTGILAISATGGVDVDQAAGTTVTAGDNGLTAVTGASTRDVRLTNAATIHANQNSGTGFGLVAQHAGTGNIVVNNAGAITGTALIGIQALHQGTGNTAVVSSGAIGSLANPIDSIGINAAALNAASTGGVSIASSGSVVAASRGLRASHAGTGAVSVANTGSVTAGVTGIEATANGGAITVATSGAGTVSGNQFGIQTSNVGTGTTSITAGNSVFGAQTVIGTAGIAATTTGAGAINVTTQSVAAQLGSAVRTTSNGGAVTVNLGTGLAAVASAIGSGAGASGWVVDLNNAGAGLSTLNIGSNTIVRSVDSTTAGYDDLVIRGIGGSVVVNNAGQLNGRVNFAGLTGNVLFNNSSAFSWHTTGLSVFSGGADVITNTAAGSIFTSAGGATTTWDFGAGLDTFNNAGLLVVGEQTTAASTLAFSSLERWNNSGRVMFGLNGNALDGQTNDRILAPGTQFTGSAGSLLVMDVNLGSIAQTGCGTLTAADCLDLTGGSTAGVTGILVNDISGTTQGGFNPNGIVLVDVSGAGTTAAGHFVLDQGSSFWRADASADGVLDKGLFFYDLILNGNKQHILVSVPDSEAFEFPTLGAATQSLWYRSTGGWFERQVDLRDRLEPSGRRRPGGRQETVASPAVWIKASTTDQDRTTASTYNLFGSSYTYDTSHDQQTTALVAGADLLSGETAGGSRWVAGAMIGYVDSDVSFDQSTTRFDLSGISVGAYGTLVHGPAFVHGLIAANQLDLVYDAPSLAGTLRDGRVDSWGFQLEGGYTFAMGERTFLEPLAGIARVSTRLDPLEVPGATIDWDDQTSLRLSLGGRIGVTADYSDLQARFSLTGRVWEEVEAANRSVINIGGSSLATLDDFGGTFSEISGGINLDGRRLSAFSAFVNAGVKWNDDYRATETSAGIRYRW